MMRLFYSCLLTFIVTCSLHAQTWNWAKRFGGPAADYGNDIFVDATGNTFSIGSVDGTVNFGSGPVSTNGGADAIVVKHNPGGLVVWSRLIGGTGSESGSQIVLDASGNIYACGRFTGTMICGPDTLVSANDDIFVVKLDVNGQILWGARGGSAGPTSEYLAGASYSAIDNAIVVAGKITDTAYFGSNVVANSQTFIAKIDANGNWVWAIGANPGVSALLDGMECDAAGYIYAATSESADLHMKKFTPSGNEIWVQSASDVSFGKEIRFDQNGNFYLLGNYTAPFTIGTVSIPIPSYTWGGFLLKFDTSGTALWGKDFQSSTIGMGALDVAPTGEIYVGGKYSSTLYTDTTFITDIYNDADEGFIVKLSPSGTFIWYKQIGTSAGDGISELKYFSNKIYFVGQIAGTANGSFSPLTIPVTYGGNDAIVGQFNDCTPPYTQVLPASGITICEGDSFHLQSSNTSGTYTYQWTNNGVPLQGATSPNYDEIGDPLYSGGYAVQITSAGCTYISHYVGVFIWPLPVVSISTFNYGPACNRDSVRLNASNLSQHNYQWYENGVPIAGATTNIYMAHATGIYSVVVASPFGCVDTFYSNTVYVGAYPNITTSNDTAICPGSSATLSVNGASSYAWTPSGTLSSSTSATPIATPTATTTYTVVGTIGSCRDTEYVDVQLYPAVVPIATYNGYQLICTGMYSSYQWYRNSILVPGATTQVISPTLNGGYHVEVIDSNGCVGASTGVLVSNVGIEEDESYVNVVIFPQPMISELTIQFPYVIDEGVLELYSLSGEIVVKETLSNSLQITLERNGLSSGMYILKIISARGELRSRVLVE